MAKVTSVEVMLLKTQFHWAGHVSRMEDHRLPTIMLYGELHTGHRDRGTPRKIYKDTLKRSLATCNIDHRQWTTQATNRMNWRRTGRPPIPLKSHEGPTRNTQEKAEKPAPF